MVDKLTSDQKTFSKLFNLNGLLRSTPGDYRFVLDQGTVTLSNNLSKIFDFKTGLFPRVKLQFVLK